MFHRTIKELARVEENVLPPKFVLFALRWISLWSSGRIPSKQASLDIWSRESTPMILAVICLGSTCKYAIIYDSNGSEKRLLGRVLAFKKEKDGCLLQLECFRCMSWIEADWLVVPKAGQWFRQQLGTDGLLIIESWVEFETHNIVDQFNRRWIEPCGLSGTCWIGLIENIQGKFAAVWAKCRFSGPRHR